MCQISFELRLSILDIVWFAVLEKNQKERILHVGTYISLTSKNAGNTLKLYPTESLE